ISSRARGLITRRSSTAMSSAHTISDRSKCRHRLPRGAAAVTRRVASTLISNSRFPCSLGSPAAAPRPLAPLGKHYHIRSARRRLRLAMLYPECLAEELLHLRVALLDLGGGGADGLDLGDGLAPRHGLLVLVHGVLVLRHHDLVPLSAKKILDKELGRVGGGRVLDDAGGGDHENGAVLGIDDGERITLGLAL